jgi:ABC-type transporter Mla maintaining outer membrane lipid asymmetry permease subunit MlaE
VAKALVFGIIVGVIPSFHGLAVHGSPTEIPVAASRAAVWSILAIFLCSGLFVLLLA